MKVLLTGAAGQLGQALIASAPEGVELIATNRQELDLADAQACRNAVHHYQPDWVLNAGAYTAMDLAESERDLAHAVNAEAPEAFASALADRGGRMLPLSTDFVFNGAQAFPNTIDQALNPLGIYGASKAAGEVAVQERLGSQGLGFVLRTSWVMGRVGTISHSSCCACTANVTRWLWWRIKWAAPPARSISPRPASRPSKPATRALSCRPCALE